MGNPQTNTLIIMIMGPVLAAGLAFLAATFWNSKRKIEKEKDQLAEEHANLVKQVRDLQMQMGTVSAVITPLNALMQAALIKELTHFHTPELDELMKKLGPPVTLTEYEERRMGVLLVEREHEVDERISDSERDAAHMLPMIVKRVKNEAETLASGPTTALKMVVEVVDDSAAPAAAVTVVETDAEEAVTDKKAQEGSGPGIGDGNKKG